MNPRVFREYDIRGNGDADFPDDFVADLGRSVGAYLADKGARRITLGRDCRLTSPRIHATMKRELLASGLDVVDVGVVHTPALYFSVFYREPDGRFPNHHPDPTVPANVADLIAKVRATGAEVGIALDGDADRIGAVDGKGRIVWGDQLVMLFARDIMTRKPTAIFVREVKCSQAL